MHRILVYYLALRSELSTTYFLSLISESYRNTLLLDEA